MQDISLHLFDILENSVKAGASRVRLTIGYNHDRLDLQVVDDGPGFPREMLERELDPYFTTRTERPVGLGLSLLKEAARQTGGNLEISNNFERGACVKSFFFVSHIDVRPFGDIIKTIVGAFIAWPQIELEVELQHAGEKRKIFDSEEIKKELDGVEPTHPQVQKFIRQTLSEELADFMEWQESVPVSVNGEDGIHAVN